MKYIYSLANTKTFHSNANTERARGRPGRAGYEHCFGCSRFILCSFVEDFLGNKFNRICICANNAEIYLKCIFGISLYYIQTWMVNDSFPCGKQILIDIFLKCDVYTAQLARSCPRTLGQDIFVYWLLWKFRIENLCIQYEWFVSSFFEVFKQHFQIEIEINRTKIKQYTAQIVRLLGIWYNAVSIGQTKMKNERILTSNRISC